MEEQNSSANTNLFDLNDQKPIFQPLTQEKQEEQKDEESAEDGEGGWGDFAGPVQDSSGASEPKEKDSEGEDVFANAFKQTVNFSESDFPTQVGTNKINSLQVDSAIDEQKDTNRFDAINDLFTPTKLKDD